MHLESRSHTRSVIARRPEIVLKRYTEHPQRQQHQETGVYQVWGRCEEFKLVKERTINDLYYTAEKEHFVTI
ncbi:hypothetical protein [Acaryochloris sp. IP29b_bin.148]|uniref:hypothetical protein n=1 Tax=Acaryochloris sp. IP29b_bin.148 TaxID=2969218 RepID=UPI00261A399C|nr:hypothetical protein [Acaryochloris sp. IP29b_bin.148]